MIDISKATKKETLPGEWHSCDLVHYGKKIEWQEKEFRFKALRDQEIIGTIDGRFESGVIFISSLIVAASARGQGVGTNLVKKAEEFGKKLGAHRTWLVTGVDWAENSFYQKLGFEKIASLPDLYFHHDFVIYSRLIK